MAEIDLGIPLRAKNGQPELDEIIAAGEPMRKPDGSPFRVKFGGPEHILTIGPTRSGKGRRLLAPELIYDTDRSIIVVDPKGELATAYKVAGMPSAVLIDRTGHVRFQHAGFSEKQKGLYEEQLQTLLAEKTH